MKSEEIEKLIEKYKNGLSTIEEELFLFDHIKNIDPSLQAWSTFVKNNKTEPPENLNDKLWKSFQNKTTKKRRLYTSIISVSASILLFVGFFTINPGQEELSYSEKEALLNQARNMFSNNVQQEMEQTIIYENDMIVVYTTSNY
ncbi:MAG: hypothetical protein AAGA77_24390 [Bacteroidota bacterium]